jgi:hypothetical protein
MLGSAGPTDENPMLPCRSDDGWPGQLLDSQQHKLALRVVDTGDGAGTGLLLPEPTINLPVSRSELSLEM